MKKILLISFSFIFTLSIFAQAPQKMTYQAVVRDAGGNLISNDNVGIRVSILQGSASGAAVFSETHVPLTNANGLATFEIGGGSVITGTIAGIDWSTGPYFIKTEVDPTGGTSYTIVSTHQMLSVPYSLYAEVAGSVAGSGSRTYLYAKKKATLQSVSSSTNTQIINYDTFTSSGISFNTSTGVVTFNTNGVYIITGHTSFTAFNPGRKIIWFNCTSSLWPVRIASNEITNDANRITTSFVGEFNAGDQINMGVFQATGVAVDCPNSTQVFDETWINIERIN